MKFRLSAKIIKRARGRIFLFFSELKLIIPLTKSVFWGMNIWDCPIIFCLFNICNIYSDFRLINLT